MSSQTLSGRVVLKDVKAQSVTVAPGVTIQGVDVTRLFSATMSIEKDVTVAAPIRMIDAVSAKSVWVAGTVQGWDLSTAAILQNSSNVVFTAPKKFVGAFHVSSSLSAQDDTRVAESRLCKGNDMERLDVVGKYFCPKHWCQGP